MPASCRVILADDHVLFRLGMKKVLEGIAGVEVIGEAGDGLELITLLRKRKPDLVMLDISMPNLRGLEAIQEIKAINPSLSVLILTMHKRKEYLHAAISAGAAGYLLKEDADIELSAAIERVRSGKIYVSPLLSQEMTDDWAQLRQGDFQPSFKPAQLTTREREVLKLIAEGKSGKEIADLLCISPRTVEHHRANMMEKLSVKKTADLVKYAVENGYV